MLFKVQQALVGVNHLLKVYLLLNNMHKLILSIILAIYAVQFLNINSVLDYNGGKNATCKITAIGNKVDVGVETALQVLY